MVRPDGLIHGILHLFIPQSVQEDFNRRKNLWSISIVLPEGTPEAKGYVKFGQGDGLAYLFDPNIYTNGRISVQGIDGVLFPPEEETK